MTSTWGKLRAEMGHPKPFGLTHLAVGNEENLPDAYFARFQKFRAAIAAKYPDITVVGNSGPDDAGRHLRQPVGEEPGRRRRHGRRALLQQPALVPAEQQPLRHATTGNGPKVFLGEYASQDSKLFNALAEAAYMTGLERNADVVKLASYAPLLANIDNVQWRPDMIWFDNDESWGSTSYQVQKLFMNNVGDRVVPSTRRPASRRRGQADHRRGRAVHLGDRGPYDDVKVTAPDGTVLFSRRLLRRRRAVDRTGRPRARWSVPTAQYVQSDAAAREHPGQGRRHHRPDYDLHAEGHQDVRRGGLPRRVRRQGLRQLLLVEPGRLEQHPGRGGEGRGGGK